MDEEKGGHQRGLAQPSHRLSCIVWLLLGSIVRLWLSCIVRLLLARHSIHGLGRNDVCGLGLCDVVGLCWYGCICRLYWNVACWLRIVRASTSYSSLRVCARVARSILASYLGTCWAKQQLQQQ